MRCEKCGFDFDSSLDRCPKCNASVEFSGNTMFYKKVKESHVSFKDIFSGTFKKHPAGTAAKIFAAGSPETTPTPDKMLAVWQKPWLYSRFLIVGILFMIVGYALVNVLNTGILAVLGTFGTLIIPFAVLLFIWEMNIPRDISFAKVLAYFFIGGIMSFVFTSIFNSFAGDYDAPFAAFAEEPAKLLITLIFIHKAKTKYGFGGMLIGAAVGTGFEVFENITYIFNSLISYGINTSVTVFFIRSLESVGGHIVWAAMAGAGAVLGRKGKSTGFRYLISPIFYICFFAGIALHFLWNGGLTVFFYTIDSPSMLLHFLLTLAAIAILFILTNKCLKQVIRVYDESRSAVLNSSPAYASAYAAESVMPAQQTPYNEQNYPQAANVSPYTPVYQNYAKSNDPYGNAGVSHQQPVYESGNIVHKPARPAFPTIKCPALNVERIIDKVINIGRDTSFCDIVFPGDATGVSRRHCAVMASSEGIVYVMDLGSSNGTFLPDGRRLVPNEWTIVNSSFCVASEKYTFSL